MGENFCTVFKTVHAVGEAKPKIRTAQDLLGGADLTIHSHRKTITSSDLQSIRKKEKKAYCYPTERATTKMDAEDAHSSSNEDVPKENIDDDSSLEGKTYEERAKAKGMRYTVTEVPPLHVSIFLGTQHFLTMLGATVLIPLIVTPEMGASRKQTAEVISTILFVSGLNTLIQTTVGDRLPIVQGGSFSYLPPTFSIIFNPSLLAITDPNERFETTMQVISGAVVVVGIVQMVLGYSGALVPVLKYISPVTIAPVIAAIGLGLYGVGFTNVSQCFSMGLTQMSLSIIFSQYLKSAHIGGYPVFALFPIILAIGLTWSLAAILTSADVWDEGSLCRTDGNREVLDEMPWLRIPYPGQWGGLKFKSFAIVPMLGGMLAGMVESIGDYYSCAKLSGAPPPTPGIVSRGLAGEGIGVFLAGLFGTGAGTTSYSENIGAMSLTRVGSRAVIQCGAIVMIVVGILGKVSALLAALPGAIVGGVYCVVFGLIVSVGLSNLQHVDLNSERNLFIIGFAIFMSLSVAGPSGYFSTVEGNPFGSSDGAEILLALFSSPMIIALLAALILDNTIAGSAKERGMHVWDSVRDADINNDPEYIKVYGLPLCLAKIFRNCGYLEYVSRGAFPEPPIDGTYKAGTGDVTEVCCCCLGKQTESNESVDEDPEYVEQS